MANEAIMIRDGNYYVGTRVYVEISLFNPRTKEPASGLAPALYFIRPNETVLEAGNMVEMEPGQGVYSASAIVDAEGDWIVEVALGAPFESRWRDDRLYVSGPAPVDVSVTAGTQMWQGNGPPDMNNLPAAEPGDEYLDLDTGDVYELVD